MFLFTKLTLICLVAASAVLAASNDQIESKRARHDTGPDLNPDSDFWHGVPGIFFDTITRNAQHEPAYRTEVRSRWTEGNLYFLFVCPYEQLNLKPDPTTAAETNHLWNWDVAEIFVGSDFKNIRKYREFEVSPQGEWIDLAIDLNDPHHGEGWMWNSGFKSAARIDAKAKVWYAFLRIPYAAVDTRTAAPGNTLRINFFRSQGPETNLKQLAWRPTMQATFHVPEAFGTLKLVK